jgi:MFS family permease
VSGVIISGALTDLASWRWIFFINLPVALVALLMVPRLVSESRMVREHRRLDLAGPRTPASRPVCRRLCSRSAGRSAWPVW